MYPKTSLFAKRSIFLIVLSVPCSDGFTQFQNGNIYTADYENGNGTLPVDLFVFDPAGNLIASDFASPV